MTLRELRKEKKITQQEFAKIVGKRNTTVSMWEAGKSNPSLKDIPLIASVLGVSVEEIVNCFKRQ